MSSLSAPLETPFSEDKLTPVAKKLIQDMEGHPLDPERFQDFLIKSFGKPLPSILPIVRGYTQDIAGVCKQLKQFKLVLKQEHREYMDAHRKDENLDKRIEKLLKNIGKEVEVEERDGRRQTAMTDFVHVED